MKAYKTHVVGLMLLLMVIALLNIHQDVTVPLEMVVNNLYKDSAENKWNTTQDERRKKMYETCNLIFGHNSGNSSILGKSSIHEIQEKIIAPNQKVMYCAISKNGCTNLKHLVAIESKGKHFSRVGKSEYTHSPSFLKRNDVYRMSDYDMHRINVTLQSYSSFMFAREPFERLLSAFRDKFEDLKRNEAVQYCRQYGIKIIQRYRKNPSTNSLKNGQDVKFHEFVKYVIDNINSYKDVKEINRHWLPQWLACQPCDIRYDFIGKMDTFKKDTNQLFSPGTMETLAKLTSGFTQRVSNRSSTSYFEKYYSQVSNFDKMRLYHVYKVDYELFGFQPPFWFLR